MAIAYRLAVFDRQTDEMIEHHDIPPALAPVVKSIANIPASDDGAGDYPLDANQVTEIGQRLGIATDFEASDYFIEPYFDDLPADIRRG